MNRLHPKSIQPAGAGAPRPPRTESPPVALRFAPEVEVSAVSPEAVFKAGLRHHHIANTAYPIAHRKTIFRFRQPRRRHADLIGEAFQAEPAMGLYAHVPFCEKRCAFCEYTVIDDYDDRTIAGYFSALFAELDRTAGLIDSRNRRLVGFDIGGGTPSAVPAHYITQLVERVDRRYRWQPDSGISIETTPRIAARHPERIADYRRAGISRISMGLQMVNPRLLFAYGRDRQKVGYNERAVAAVRKAGFTRFNIDLMYGFARQRTADFIQTLKYTIGLSPEYITLYRMRYKGTKVAGEAGDIDLSRVMEMYEAARTILAENGYPADFGKNGFSRVAGDSGASEYLTCRVVQSTPYLGLGLGAQTFTNNLLSYNLGAAEKRLGGYQKAVSRGWIPIQDLYHLPPSEGMAKMISVSFYFGGINRAAFQRRFGVSLEAAFSAEVRFAVKHRLMTFAGDTLRLTERGAKVINGVIALFYSPRVKAHLLSLDEDTACGEQQLKNAGPIGRGRS
jgi:oxygen-independent coproporphyrinogen-3 oxidase